MLTKITSRDEFLTPRYSIVRNVNYLHEFRGINIIVDYLFDIVNELNHLFAFIRSGISSSSYYENSFTQLRFRTVFKSQVLKDHIEDVHYLSFYKGNGLSHYIYHYRFFTFQKS